MTDTDQHTEVGPGAHVVHFFDSEDSLAVVASRDLGGAIVNGETLVVVATPAHWDSFVTALEAASVDVAAAIGEGRLVVRDAAHTLGLIARDNGIDPEAFDTVVGGLVRSAAATDRPVRVYGEMVALLMAGGRPGAALELERLWNQLANAVRFSLFCAYPADLFIESSAVECFAEVCGLHAAVVDGAPGCDACEVSRRFPRTPVAATLVRRFVAQTLRDWRRDELVDDVAQVATELATNGVIHARSDLAVGLSRLDDRAMRLVVSDTSGSSPILGPGDAGAVNGRGLQMVHAIAKRWGHEIVDDGKYVWVELAPITEVDEPSPR